MADPEMAWRALETLFGSEVRGPGSQPYMCKIVRVCGLSDRLTGPRGSTHTHAYVLFSGFTPSAPVLLTISEGASIDCYLKQSKRRAERQPKTWCGNTTYMSRPCQACGQHDQQHPLAGLRGACHREEEEDPLVRECQEDTKPKSCVLGSMVKIYATKLKNKWTMMMLWRAKANMCTHVFWAHLYT